MCKVLTTYNKKFRTILQAPYDRICKVLPLQDLCYFYVFIPQEITCVFIPVGGGTGTGSLKGAHKFSYFCSVYMLTFTTRPFLHVPAYVRIPQTKQLKENILFCIQYSSIIHLIFV